MALSGARDIAVEALRDRDGNVTARLERLSDQASLPPAERGLARELALGTLRRQGTLTAVLRAFLQLPNRKLPSPVDHILEVALYQILYLDRVPQFAAVNEAVEQASRFHHHRQSGFVNGVLRSLTRGISPLQQGEMKAAIDVVPVGPGAFRTADRPVFSSPTDSPAAYLAGAYSLPSELATRWVGQLGLPAAIAVATQANQRAPLVMRVNRLRADVPAVLKSLAADGVAAEPHENGVSVVTETQAIESLQAFRHGWVQPQDATATEVVLTAAPQPGWRVLDLCAAPGTKTTMLAELMGNKGVIIALDVTPEKLQPITTNCERMGVEIVQTDLAPKAGGLPLRSFDLVLADVPCSNTGVLARRAEARWRFTPADLSKTVRSQRDLAVMAAWFVKPGGRLVYSTCSIEPEENGGVVRGLLAQVPHMKLVSENLTLPRGESPTTWRDGGYCAVLKAT